MEIVPHFLKDIKRVDDLDRDNAIIHYYGDRDNLKIPLVGSGSSSYVFDNNDSVYKMHKKKSEGIPADFVTEFSLSALANSIDSQDKPFLSAQIIRDEKNYFITMPKKTYCFREYTQSNRFDQRLSNVQNISKQMIKILYYLEKVQIIHRDIKPANLLIDDDNKIFLVDFGIARYNIDRDLDKYVRGATRWYRSPEVCRMKFKNNMGHYDYRLDVWSMGATLLEFIVGKPIFTGKTGKMMSEFRKYSNENGLISVKYILDTFLETEEVEQIPYLFINLIEKMLTRYVRKRPYASQLINHPYVEQLIDFNINITPIPIEKIITIRVYKDIVNIMYMLKMKKRNIATTLSIFYRYCQNNNNKYTGAHLAACITLGYSFEIFDNKNPVTWEYLVKKISRAFTINSIKKYPSDRIADAEMDIMKSLGGLIIDSNINLFFKWLKDNQY